MKNKNFILFLLAGFLAGAGIGILISWVLAPVQFVDATPASLRADFKDDYRLLIASAYDANTDLLRARARLDTLADADPATALAEQSGRMEKAGVEASRIALILQLANSLKPQAVASIPTASATPTARQATATVLAGRSSQTPTPTSTALPPAETEVFFPTTISRPTSTPRILPTRTTTPTPGKPFALAAQSTFCDEKHPGLLKVVLAQANGKPLAGVELTITWVDGTESFFTGLKPELGAGYADFIMTRDVEYTLSFSKSGTQPTILTAPDCGNYPGGISLEFRQP